jgi:hypothetical protein
MLRISNRSKIKEHTHSELLGLCGFDGTGEFQSSSGLSRQRSDSCFQD